MNYSHVFEPGKIGKLEIPNRIVMPAMGTNFAEADGSVGARTINYYKARAKGGTGLITVETCAVTPAGGRAVACSLSLHDGKYLPGMHELTDAVHAYGAKVSVQLNHTGRQAVMESNHCKVPVAPSALACPMVSCYDVGVVPRALTSEEIEEIIGNYAAAAKRAVAAGFDAVELHGAHGYLINEFLSPLTNKRDDEYGGSFEKRLTFARKVINAVREKIGSDIPIIIRLNAEDHMDGGLVMADTKKIAAAVVEAGVDAISVSSGMYPSLYRVLAPIYLKPGFLMPFCAEVKSVVDVPVIGVGRIANLALADKVLSQKMADFVAIGRAQIAEPEIVNKSRSGQLKDIRNCIYCNYCSMDRLLSFMQVRCAVNAEAGREAEYAITRAPVAKKVVVIGGGPGGMEAARVAALRGHQVTLFEKRDCLGGQLTQAAAPKFKEPVRSLINYLSYQIENNGVAIKMGRQATAGDVLALSPDVVIIATGAGPWIPSLPGAELAVTAHDVLDGGLVDLIGKIVVCGGGSVGCETALFLAERSHDVTLLEMLDEIAVDHDYYSRSVLLEEIEKSTVKVITGHKMINIGANNVTIADKSGGHTEIIAGTVIFAAGSRPIVDLAETLRGTVELYTIGDCNKPGRVHNAIHEAAHIAREI
ncbi:MAG: hypothetical protein VR64_12340 [Desulfatitalea sp. BRH_c12]|nr:MAG: hypothetical protein VR64_12340 [Desulfatitalea sp. BRH_c12]